MKRSSTSRVCKFCGEGIQRWGSCPFCKREQNWMGSLPEPTWWPNFLPTLDQGKKTHLRWTSYALISGCIAFLVLLFSLLAIFGPDEEPGFKMTYDIPNLTGMNLQSAQDCLQSWGYTNLDFDTGGWHLWDRNYVVTGQNVFTVESKDAEIILKAIKSTNGDYGTSECP